MKPDMRRDFATREELIAYLRDEFPASTAIDNNISATRGGRRAAEARLDAIEPAQYGRSRGHIGGAVTRLSMYLRYGVLSLAEVRDTVLQKAKRGQGGKLINELAWRDYWQRMYAELGDGIWHDLEPYKTGWAPPDYASELPSDIEQGSTGLPCIDAFSQELRTTGYLHNHVRMWLAAYVVHWRRVSWQAGARWFLQHLLDGDPASINLSWQWIASTFSHKPYIFNRANLERSTDALYCNDCPLYGHCTFEGSYGELAVRLFPNNEPGEE